MAPPDGLEDVSSTIFADEHLKWARFPDPVSGKPKYWSVRDMLAELDEKHTTKGTGHIACALSFFDTSHFVHSDMQSLRGFTELVQETTYIVKGRLRREASELALVLSNIWMLMAINAVNGFVGAQLDTDIEALSLRLKNYGKPFRDIRA